MASPPTFTHKIYKMKRVSSVHIRQIVGYACTCLLFAIFTLSAQQASAQKTDSGSPTHFRNFEVEITTWTDQDMDQLRRTFADKVMVLRQTCRKSNTILVAVDASYPKRVEAIREEISAELARVLSADRIVKIESIPHQKTINYCK